MLSRLIYFIVVLGLLPVSALAFNSQQTHPLLTELAVDNLPGFSDILQHQLGMQDTDAKLSNGQFKKSVTEWLMIGSKEEDIPMCRASSHFHDPLKALGKGGRIFILDK